MSCLKDRQIKRKLTDIKGQMFMLSRQAKNCSLSCTNRFQKKLLAQRYKLMVRFILLKTKLQEPEKYAERVSIYDI